MKNKSIKILISVSMILFVLFALYAIVNNVETATKKTITPKEIDTIELARNRNFIAANDQRYKANPVIEGLVLLNHRGGGFQVEMAEPELGSPFILKDGKVNIPFSGSFIKRNTPLTFQLKVYSNDMEAYENDTPILNQSVTSKANENGNQYFDLHLATVYSQGLYYFLLENKENEQIITAGKFRIE